VADARSATLVRTFLEAVRKRQFHERASHEGAVHAPNEIIDLDVSGLRAHKAQPGTERRARTSG